MSSILMVRHHVVHIAQTFHNVTLACFLLLDFDFVNIKLCKKELVFYYQRMTLDGLFYNLLEEYERELMPYSILPLNRPTSSLKAAAKLEESERRLSQYRHDAAPLLLRAADMRGEGEELISRDGNIIAAAPQLRQSRVNAPADIRLEGSANSKKRKFSGNEETDRKLLADSKNMASLKALIKDFRIPGAVSKLNKTGLITMICSATEYD